MTAERHRRPGPERRGFRQDRRRLDRAQRAEAGREFFHQRFYAVALQILGFKSVDDPAEIPQPSSGLRQRHPDLPASALARLARLRHHGAERHEVAGGVIEHLRRQFLRPLDAGGLAFGVIETGRGLHQRVKSAALRPRPGMAVGRQRYINDAWVDPCDVLRREAEGGDGGRPIALRDDIGLSQQSAKHFPPLLALELQKTRQLAAAGIDGEPGDRRQIGTGDQQHVGAVHGERAARDGPRDHARQIEHAHACQRAVALWPRLWRRLADFLDSDQRQFGQRARVRRRRPFLMRAHHRDHAAGGIGRGLEGLAVPLHQRGLNLVALRLAVKNLADGVAMMPEIGVQPHEALVAGFVDSGDGVPGRRRRLAIDTQIALGAAFDQGVTHIDRDILALPAARFPDLRGSQSRRGDAGLRRGGDAKRRRQLRLCSAQRDGVERGRIAACLGPDVRENFPGTLHELHSSVPSKLPWSCSVLIESEPGSGFCLTRFLRTGTHFARKRCSMEGVAMAAIDPLTAGGVLLATPATDAVYVMFTSAVVARRRVPAATRSSVWYLLSSYGVISYTGACLYVAFAAVGSWLSAL